MKSSLYHIIFFHLMINLSMVSGVLSQSNDTTPIVVNQSRVGFENYSAAEGLSQNSCYAITQDSDGFLWFGTQDGLNRYDGNQFKVFRPESINKTFQLSNHIISLVFDENRNILWVGTTRGLCLYIPETHNLMEITDVFGINHPVLHESIKKTIIDDHGNLIGVTARSTVFKLSPDDKKVQEINHSGDIVPIEDIITYDGVLVAAGGESIYKIENEDNQLILKEIMTDKRVNNIRTLAIYNDRLWVGTINSGSYYVENILSSPTSYKFPPTLNFGVGNFTVDSNNKLWIGSRGKGVLVYDENKNTIQWADYDPKFKHSLSRNFTVSSFTDRQGNVWIGLSGAGVDKYDPYRFQFHNIQTEPFDGRSLPDHMVFSIFKTTSSDYYVGTQNRGLLQWDISSDEFKSFPFFSQLGLTRNTIYGITEDKEYLYLASWEGLIKHHKTDESFELLEADHLPQSQKLLSVHKLLNKNKLLVGSEIGASWYHTDDGTWEKWITNQDMAGNWIARYVYQDNEKHLWVCTEGANLIKINTENYQITQSKRLQEISKTTRHLDKDGDYFWIATDNGIVKYNIQQDSIYEHIRFDDLYSSNVTYSVHKDTTGAIWTGTNFGLVKIKDKNIINYGLENGLNFLEFNTASTLKDTNMLYYGGVGGITGFSPYKIYENYYSPTPKILEVTVNDDIVIFPDQEKMELQYDQNYLTFYFSNNNFSNSVKNNFHYRLLGSGTEWVNNHNRFFTTFAGLQPGNYTFELKSSNGDGFQSKGTSKVSFVIHPPWWKSNPFLGLVILSLAALTFFFIRHQINEVKERAELKNRISETKMMALRAQMNPHFIFNCLNSIDALILSNNKVQATKYLNKFAKLLRSILDSSNQTIVPFTKDLENLKLYIELEEMRSDDAFATTYEVDDELMSTDYKVPPLIIQPYVENAIIHGIRNLTDKQGKLIIKIELHDDFILYSIIDNGVGRAFAQYGVQNKRKKSYGITMSENRVKYYNQENKASVEIIDLEENTQSRGTMVNVKLKI